MPLEIFLAKRHLSDGTQYLAQGFFAVKTVLGKPQKLNSLTLLQKLTKIWDNRRRKTVPIEIQTLQLAIGYFFDFLDYFPSDIISDVAFPNLLPKYLRIR
jgi:hypothetical protein